MAASCLGETLEGETLERSLMEVRFPVRPGLRLNKLKNRPYHWFRDEKEELAQNDFA